MRSTEKHFNLNRSTVWRWGRDVRIMRSVRSFALALLPLAALACGGSSFEAALIDPSVDGGGTTEAGGGTDAGPGQANHGDGRVGGPGADGSVEGAAQQDAVVGLDVAVNDTGASSEKRIDAEVTPDAGCVRKNQCDGENCGDKSDGCGGTWHCGDCAGTDECGTAGKANVCNACVPKTCAVLGYACGARSNGCGGTVDCGGCPQNSACGAGANPKLCGQWIEKCQAAAGAGVSCMSLVGGGDWHTYCSSALLSAHGCTASSTVASCPGGSGYVCNPATLSGP